MDKKFISYLSNKLKTGNLNSIHLNALPGRLATRLDLKKLDIITGYDEDVQLFETKNGQIADEFLFENLFKKAKFKFKINFDNVPFKGLDENAKKKFDLIARKLNAIVNQEEDSYLEHGVKTFSFGYPLLVKRSKVDPKKIIKSPVLIWSLDIARSNTKQNEWVVEQVEESPIYINEVLVSHIANDENIVIGDLPNDFLEDNLIDDREILEIVNEILAKFNTNADVPKALLEYCPDKVDIEEKTGDKPWIQWSGVFGLFKTQKQPIIKDSDKLAEDADNYGEEEEVKSTFRNSTNTSVPTDPSQEEIINTIDSSEFKLIQGPPGTGKSQSLTALITNTLENNQKILVVCEKKTALDVIYNNLKKLGLDKLIAIIDDVNRDRKGIIDTVRAIAEKEQAEPIGFNETEYDAKLERYHQMVADFNYRHHNLLKKVFKGYNVQELISEYLNLKKTVEKEERLLLELDFKFEDNEYDQLLENILQAKDLFEEIPEETFAYDILSKENFKDEFSVQREKDIIARIDTEIEFLKNIETSCFCLSNVPINKFKEEDFIIYNIENIDKYNFNNQLLLNYWKNLVSELEKVQLHFKNSDFLNTTTLSKKVKEFHSLYDNINNQIQDLTKIEETLYLLSLEYNKLPDEVRTGNIHFGSSGKLKAFFSSKHKAIRNFHEFYLQTLTKINSLVIDNGMNNTNINLQEIIKGFLPIEVHINDLIKDLSFCKENTKWFREYYNWRHFYDVLDDLSYNCIAKLSDYAPAKEWRDLFRLNYTNLFIEMKANSSEDFNENGKMLVRIGELQEELKLLHRHKIMKIWEERSWQSIQKYNEESNIKWLFNYRKNSKYNKKNTLRSIMHDEFDLFTDIFPVVLVNPVVCSSILPLKHHLFEIVLFDEASQLRLEDTYPALIRGKIKVISGDKHQMPPSNYFAADIPLEVSEDAGEEEEFRSNFDKANPLFLAESESLLDFGNNLNPKKINISFLDYHYRSKHPFLIDFSNVAFYGGRLIPMPERTTYKPVRFFQVNGRYRKDNTNLDEALRIIDYLKDNYPSNKDGSYPSLGIATFNMQQRNLVKDLIIDECIKDEEFRAKMNQIGRNEEWFVKNLENIQGDERDIIIISTTFGKNEEGKFRQSFGPINTSKGYKLLNVIITRAKKQLYLFTSIPDEYISSYTDDIETSGNKGKAILYAYLDYCRAIENGNEEHRRSILEILEQGCEEEAVKEQTSVRTSSFKQEVYDYLGCFIKPENFVRDYKLGGYLIDFVILNDEGKPFIAIECDGAYWHNTEQAFSHDLHREKILEAQGLQFYRVWSKSWWPDPGKEIERLLQFVGKLNGSVLKEIEQE